MKKIILLLFVSTLQIAFGQCVDLTVKEHFAGEPLFRLESGDIVQICEDSKEISFGGTTLYILTQRGSGGTFIYEFKMDDVYYSPKYGEIQINTNTKKFGITLISGNQGAWTYYTESEMESIRTSQSENQKKNNQKFLEEAQANDQKIKIEINSALEKKEYFKALQLFNEFNFKDNDLLIKIIAGWLPEKERYSIIYQNYTAEFNQVKKEYFTSEKDFYSKFQNSIKSKEISINGKEAYTKRIASNSDQIQKVYREDLLDHDGYVYTKNNNKHLICPVGIYGNYYAGRYNEQIIDKLNIKLLYDTSANTYVPFIEFYKNEKLISSSPIVNTNAFQINYFLMPFPMEINALYQKVTNESGRKMLESLFPQQTLYLNSSEPISLIGLSTTSYPGDGKRNDKYESLKKEFEIVRKDVEKLAKDENKLITENFYNPSILYLVKKIYPNADTLVFAFGDFKESLGNLGLHIDYDKSYKNMTHSNKIENSAATGGSFVPLSKGVVELKNNKFIIYDKMGNYREVSANLILTESKLPLTQLLLDNLNLDSTFINKNFDSRYDIGYVGQYPIFYKQLVMGSDQNKAKYIMNESLIFQILPIYKNIDTELPNSRSIYDPMYNLALNFNCRNCDLTFDGMAKKYFKEMTKYFEFKNEKNSKKAIVSLNKANQYLESFKQTYLDPK